MSPPAPDAADLTADDHLAVETDTNPAADADLPPCDQTPAPASDPRERVAASAVLAAAAGQIGTVERPPGSNRTPYGVAYGSDGLPWCAMFVWWAFREAGASPLIPKVAYTPTFAQWFRDDGSFRSTPQVGAVVFYDFPNDGVNRISHAGIVEAVNGDGTIQTIEGNTTSGGAAAGEGVWRRTRRTGIVGYGYPRYDAAPEPEPVPVPDADREAVRRTQAAVHVAVDGEWGPDTDRAVSLVRDAAQGRLRDVRATQRAVGAPVDGSWGPRSRAALTATVRALQAAWGVAVDGDWGPVTDTAWAELRRRAGRGI